ncbi:MAG: fasciclin domain-containing protein [Phycisphaerales bacterium]|nr:MAG: fasciclin domain-containing protein [Phycisphaerales bacterium]
MFRKLAFLFLVLGFCLSPTLQAANIVWVSQAYDNNGDGVLDDQGWVDLLVAEGYEVDYQPDNWLELDADKIATLNAADLVIVSRASGSGSYDDGDEPTQWNAVTTPLLLKNLYITRSSRWRWVDSTSITNLVGVTSEVLDTTHPIFEGVPLSPPAVDPNAPIDPNAPEPVANLVLITDPNVGTGQTSHIGSLDMGNGVALAQALGESAMAIAEWDKGVEYYPGSGQFAGGPRMLFAAGTQETSGTTQGELNLTAEGLQIFLNAVDYMISIPYRYASAPIPANGASDLLRDEIVLGWTAGVSSSTRDVYLGTSMEDVAAATVENPLDVLVSAGQEATSSDPGRLEFGTTYYWRVDEIDPAPSSKVYAGPIWSFTVEPYILPIEDVTAVASSAYSEALSAERTVDGSGLDENDLHSANGTTMWLSDITMMDVLEPDPNDPNAPLVVYEPVWLLYEFDKAYKVDQMWVWNSNTAIEAFYGYGLKDVTIEYSTDGDNWMSLGDFELAQAPGTYDYAHETIDFGGVVAKYVRIDAHSNWGGGAKFGLSEVRFYSVPIRAREPQPADGATGIAVTDTLSWRAGLQADVHEVYVSSSEDAVASGAALVDVVDDTSFDLGSMALNIGTTYYWKVNEVNDAETPSFLDGDIWSFATQDYFVVDDFESYNGELGDTWKDGWKLNTGVRTGHTGSATIDNVVANSGTQSMMLSYDNAKSPYIIEVERGISSRKNWTNNGVRKLVVFFHGDPGNNSSRDKLYVTINGKKVTYGGSTTNPWWQSWSIDLRSLGINIRNIVEIGVGVGDVPLPSGGKGKVYIDDIRLYRSAPSVPTILEAAMALNKSGDLKGQFDTLLAAVMAGDPAILEELSSEGAYTVFAPTDDAFAEFGIDAGNVASLDAATLNDILMYHVAAGKLMADDVLAAAQIEMIAGGSLAQADGMLTDNVGRQAGFVATDGEASNGVIHVIDAVVLPYEIRNIVEMMVEANSAGDLAGQLDELVAIVQDNPALLGLLSGDDEYTVLAPTDDAVAALRVDADQNLLMYHIAAGKLLAADVLAAEELQMLNGGTVGQAGGVLTDAAGRQVMIVVTDIIASNGVIHVIDAVLLPVPLVENASFELPGTEKQRGFDAVPGWATDADVVDSGVETGWTPTDGEWTAYLMGGDPAVYQMTSMTLAEGDLVTLKVDARITWAATTLRMTLYYEDANGVRVPAATADVALTEEMQEYALELNAYLAPEAIGKTIGIEFENVSGANTWIGLDNVRLEGPTEAPEPVPFVNLLANGGFEDGVTAPWSTYGDATMEVVGEGAIEGTSCLHVTVNSAGANFWDAGLQHTGHVFEAGKQYTLSAYLRCSEGTLDINFKPEKAADPWTGYGDQIFTMTDVWTEYTVTTPVLEEDVDPAAITFHIAFAPGDFYVDDVKFYEGEYVPAQ